MAGSYPDVLAPKIFYESDGTFVHFVAGEVITEYSTAQKILMNDESMGTVYDSGVANQLSQKKFVLTFPEHRDILGCVLSAYGNWNGISGFSTSPDTTNGIDGVWTNVAGGNTGTVSAPSFRTINAVNWTNVKGLRFFINATGDAGRQAFQGLHIYGYPTSLAGLDRLLFWHPTINQALGAADLDFGNVVRLTNPTKAFRIKNNSTTLTANSIVISQAELTVPNPTIVSQTLFDNAGAGYVAAPNIGNLSPGAISGVITQRFSPVTNAVISAWRQRVQAVAGSWT